MGNETENEQVKALVVQATELSDNAGRYVIANNDALEGAADLVKQIKGKYNELDALRKSLTAPLDESKKRIMAFFKPPLERLASAESAIKGGIVSFSQEQERKRQEAIREQRRELERQARAKEAEAKAAEAAGKAERAAELRQEKVEIRQEKAAVPVLTPPAEVRKVEGVATRKTWHFKIVDLAAVPRDFLIPNEKLLQSVATSLKEKAAVSGVEFYFEESVSIKA